MPFSLKILQKISSLLKNQTLPDLEAKAVSEKISYKKDSILTVLEAQQASSYFITEQAEKSMNRLKALQNHYQNLTSEEVLKWITAVEAMDTYDSPQKKEKIGQQSKQNIRFHAASSKAALENGSLNFEGTWPHFAEQLRKAVDDRLTQDRDKVLEDFDKAASLENERKHILFLKTLNDQTTGSLTSMTSEGFSVLLTSFPFLFAILSRKNDYYGLGSMGTDTSSGGVSGGRSLVLDNSSSGIVAHAPILYHIVTGQHDHSTNLTGFTTPPHLEFLQGSKGSFSLQKLYTRYNANESVYKYPYAAVGIFYLQNTTDQDLKMTVFLEGSADSSSYGAGVFTSSLESMDWTPLYTLLQTHPNFGIDVEIKIPAQKTTVIMIITTATPLSTDTLLSQFLSFTVSGFRLQPGIVMNIPTLLSTSEGGF